jgi:CBS domain-containing protein
MSSMTVREITPKGFVSINEDEMLTKAMSIFKEQKPEPPVIIVLNSLGKYKGIIVEKWIARSHLNPDVIKVKKFTSYAPKLVLESSLSSAAKLMIENDLRQLPVFDGEKLVGIVTDEDIIHPAVMEKFGNTKVEDIMGKDLIVIEEDASVGSVISLFRDQGFSRAPVVKEGKLVGIVTDHDIVEKIIEPRYRLRLEDRIGEKVPVLSIPVKGIMTSPVITVSPSTKIREAEEIMHNSNVSSLVVIRDGKPVGIMTKRDILEPIAQLEKIELERLTVQFAVKGAEMNETQKNIVLQDFNSFARRYEKALKGGTLFAQIKLLGRKYREWPLVHCRLQLRTRNGLFASIGEGWGIEQTFKLSLDRLERQILRSKELELGPRFSKRFFREITF